MQYTKDHKEKSIVILSLKIPRIFDMLPFGGLKVTYSAVSKAIPQAKPRSGLVISTGHSTLEFNLRIERKNFAKKKDFFFSLKQTEFPRFSIGVLILRE